MNFWPKNKQKPQPQPTKTAEELTAMLPRHQCDHCNYAFAGDPKGRSYCQSHGWSVHQISGAKWDDFYPELERYNRSRSELLRHLSGREGWSVYFDAVIGKYALFPPRTGGSIANPGTGTHTWEWEELVKFVCES